MLEWPRPRSLKALRGFLGLTRYYRRLIKDYGSITSNLTVLLKKNCFKWGKEAEDTFPSLKRDVTQPPVLALPYISKPFCVECNVLGKGVGAILMQ